MNKVVENMSKKRGILLSIASSEEMNIPEADVIEDNEFNMKIRIEIPKNMMIRNFNFVAEFSLFRVIKNMILSPVKISIITPYTKSIRLDI